MMDLAVIDSEASGLLPSGWSERKLRDVAQLINGRGFKPFEWDTTGLPIIRIQNLNGSDEFNYYSGRYDPKIEVDSGQLLFAWSGSRGTSFGPHIWNGPKGVLNYHTWKVQVKESEIAPRFFFHVLKHLTKIVEGQAHGASALVHVQKWEMEKFPFQCPDDPKEQEAIAEALSDADALIVKLERLITKKRLIMQGAMEDLLNAERRLSGFSGEWEIFTVGDFLNFKNGLNKAKSFFGRGTPIVNYMDVFCGGRIDAVSIAGLVDVTSAEQSAYGVKDGDILFTRTSETPEEIGLAAVADGVPEGTVFSGFVLRGRPQNGKLTRNFTKYCFRSEPIRRQIIARATYTTRALTNGRQLSQIEMFAPSDVDEQNAIAAVLSDMDAEIQALESRLEKARQVKEGVMQNLLTGRIRLI